MTPGAVTRVSLLVRSFLDKQLTCLYLSCAPASCAGAMLRCCRGPLEGQSSCCFGCMPRSIPASAVSAATCPRYALLVVTATLACIRGADRCSTGGTVVQLYLCVSAPPYHECMQCQVTAAHKDGAGVAPKLYRTQQTCYNCSHMHNKEACYDTLCAYSCSFAHMLLLGLSWRPWG